MKQVICLALKAFLFSISILYSLTVYSQNHTIDSFQRVLQTEKEDTNKVNTLNAFAREFRYIKADTAIYFINKALALAEKLDYQMGIADSKKNCNYIALIL